MPERVRRPELLLSLLLRSTGVSSIEHTTEAESVSLCVTLSEERLVHLLSPHPHLPFEGRKEDTMEFWQDEKKIAFTTKPTVTELTTNVGYVWEKNGLTGPPFKYTASFVTETDARVYLAAKYPHAVEKITSAAEEVASRIA